MNRHRFERIYETHYDAVLRYCLRRTAREDALDAAADTFSVAWRRRSDMPLDDPLPWLYGVARRVLANQHRSARRRQGAAAYLRVAGDDPPEGPELQVIRDEEAALVVAALGRLQPADREIIQLAGWEQLGRSAIATAMQCTPNAVTKRLNRALDRLARELGTRRSGGRFFRSQGVS